MNCFDELREMISCAQSVLLLPHVHADGDALGSCLGLKLFLESLGKKAYILAEEQIDRKLEFLAEKAGCGISVPGDGSVPDPKKIDLAIAVDVATPERLGHRGSEFKAAGASARIDHHDPVSGFSRYSVVDPEWAATAEGIYLLIRDMGFDGGPEAAGDPSEADTESVPETDRKIAAALYSALVTDTGCFGYSNVTPQTHYVASRLRALAGDMSYVYHLVYEVQTRGYVRLMKQVHKNLQLTDEGIAWVALTRRDFEEAQADDNDSEGVANFLRSIEGIHAGVFVKPDKYPGRYRVSMRSDELVDVARIATKYSGGGHLRAAGCTLSAGTEAEFKRELGELLSDISDAIIWAEAQ